MSLFSRTVALFLIATLALPAWSSEDCCCSSRQAGQGLAFQKNAADHSENRATLSPCCAARLKRQQEAQRREIKQAASSTGPQISHRCECHREIQSVTGLTVSSSPKLGAWSDGWAAYLTPQPFVMVPATRSDVITVDLPSDHSRPRLAQLCRWLA